MPVPAVEKYVDTDFVGGIGTLYKNPASPITITSSEGWQQMLIIDNTLEPVASANVPNPWLLKWKITNSFIARDYMYYPGRIPLLDMRMQYSGDAVTWENFKNCSVVPYLNMTGRFPYKLALSAFPRYIRVVARIYPEKDGTETSLTLLMGMEDFITTP